VKQENNSKCSNDEEFLQVFILHHQDHGLLTPAQVIQIFHIAQQQPPPLSIPHPQMVINLTWG
jgi:hypothetical protein